MPEYMPCCPLPFFTFSLSWDFNSVTFSFRLPEKSFNMYRTLIQHVPLIYAHWLSLFLPGHLNNLFSTHMCCVCFSVGHDYRAGPHTSSYALLGVAIISLPVFIVLCHHLLHCPLNESWYWSCTSCKSCDGLAACPGCPPPSPYVSWDRLQRPRDPNEDEAVLIMDGWILQKFTFQVREMSCWKRGGSYLVCGL